MAPPCWQLRSAHWQRWLISARPPGDRTAPHEASYVGTIVDPEFIRLGAFLRELTSLAPELDPELRQGMSGTVAHWICKGELDVGFLPRERPRGGTFGHAAGRFLNGWRANEPNRRPEPATPIPMLALVRAGVALSLARESAALHEQHVNGLVIADQVSIDVPLTFVCLAAKVTGTGVKMALEAVHRTWQVGRPVAGD